VQVEEFWPYLCRPVDARVQLVSSNGAAILELPLKEQSLTEDADSSHPDLAIGFNAYSGSGDVTAEVVYANYGTKADFAKLKELGVDCRGKIVIARYGGNYRGFKAKFAEAAGAAGLIIYTDPDDSGYRKGVPYPEGCWANESYIQRGSIETLEYPGDPLTPGTPATRDAARLKPDEIALPRIPVQPIGYGAAREIFQMMRGTPLPQDLIKTWQGGLPCAYRLAGGPELKVRLMVKQERFIGKTANVIATLRGSTHPEQKIIVGCHHDAWGFGAADPLAGTMLLLESARSFSEALKQGRRPARSIVFAAWGAEEFGIIGSTEYCEQHRDDLSKNAVAYINLDMAAMGPNFGASASPSLKRIIEEAARDVPQPGGQAGQSVLQKWLGEKAHVEFGNLGGGSDHIGFYCHLGIPSCGLGGEGSQGTSYHSNYDTLTWYRKTVGDGYEPALMLTRIVNLIAARLANAALLPLDPQRYGVDCTSHFESLAKRAEELKLSLDLSPLICRAESASAAGQQVTARLIEKLEHETLGPPQLDSINAKLLMLERLWLVDGDARWQVNGRSWFRNAYAASDPDSGYAAWMMPILKQAIEARDQAGIERAVGLYQAILERLGERIAAVQAPAPN
jgi:N-acetylated-alpha-linked acidic dipeptidase